MKNDNDIFIIIFKHSRVKTINDYDEKNCYMIDSNFHEFAAAWKLNEIKISKFETTIKFANGIIIYGKKKICHDHFKKNLRNFF